MVHCHSWLKIVFRQTLVYTMPIESKKLHHM
jgi:hypothetical protein